VHRATTLLYSFFVERSAKTLKTESGVSREQDRWGDVSLAKGTPGASVLPYEIGRGVVRTFSEAVC
jgi:hypothetical protein